jgi:hypothetical protein
MKEFLKAIIILIEYGALGPLLGLFIARHRNLQRAALALMVFMTSWFPGKLTLMLDSIEFYRGHTKGFEFSLIEVVAIALIVSAARNRRPSERRLPPGAWLYLGYCLLSCLSLIPAMNKVYALMAAFKFTKAVLIFIGAYHGVRDLEDLRWVLHTMAGMLVLQVGVGLKERFVDHMWQVKGWFEHQNPMAMWAYLCALPLLSTALARPTSRRDTGVYLIGVAAAAVLVLLSVSRAALAAFVVGCAAVTFLVALRGVTLKLTGICALGVLGVVAANLVAMNSVKARLEKTPLHPDDDLRAILIVQSRAMLHDSFLGVGWNNFGLANSRPAGRYSQILEDWDASRGFTIYDENYHANPLTESLYWLLLAETGYPGFVGYVLFEAATLWWLLRGLIRFWRSPTGYFVAGVLVGFAIMYGHSTVERILTQTKNLSLWLILAGMAARVEQCRRERHDLPPSWMPDPP